MTDIVEVADGQLIEPPLTVEQRLAEHCAYSEATFTNGDYFHLLAKDAAALIASQAARIRELEEFYRAVAHAAGDLDQLPDSHAFEIVWCHSDEDGNPAPGDPFITAGMIRRARSPLSRKGGE